MAENNSLPNSNDVSECEEDGIVTMVDVLKAEEILEEDANAVLGPGDDKNCTYSEGYVKRQALYSCLTCLPSDGPDRAGLCLACSYHCHADHELVELYTKRNFRCDCGNSLFKGRSCTLDPVKSRINENNSYNQNFRGVYCSCSRPYPDPEIPLEDFMLQCIICEDWYHASHLGNPVPNEDDYAEMICGPCTDELPFLQYYLGYAVSKVSKSGDEGDSEANISVNEVNTSLNSSQELAKGETSEGNKKSAVSLHENKVEAEDKKCLPEHIADVKTEDAKEKEIPKQVEEISTANTPGGAEVSEEASVMTTAKKIESATEDGENTCKLKSLKMLPRGNGGATYWRECFRKLLCACSSCKDMYESHKVSFLIDEEDTMPAYENLGKPWKKAAGTTQYERGMEALSSLDRVQQMEAILSYNEMKTHLSEYLAKFVENKKVVREEDIREFFTGMQARKRQKLDIPYNCR